jgi:Predicted branched-chain amino acid permeases (azaleucine resistance)
MQNSLYPLAVIAVVAFITLCTRALPFLLFRNTESIPRFVTYLGGVLPYAIMGMLIVYCLKSVSVLTYPYGIPEFISVAAVVLLHRWKHNTLLSVGAGTALYMLLVQLVFV